MMTPLETLNSLTEKAAAQAFVQSHSHGGSVQLCSDEYVPPLQIKEGETLLIDWDCGGGKSCRIRDRLQDLFIEKPSARVLLTSVRIIHALDLKQALSSAGVEPALYTDYVGRERELMEQRCVVISAEQLLHVRLVGDRPFDMLILDEVRSLCDKFKRQSTLSSYESVLQLEHAYKTARYVIAADADCHLDNAVTYMLGGMATRPVQTLRGSHKQLKRTLYCEFSGGGSQKPPVAFSHALSKGGRLAVVCGSKATAQAYGKECLEMGVPYAIYHGGVSARLKADHFANPDEAWVGVQCVIYNTCLTVGVDPKTTVFSKIFVHTSRNGGSLRDLFQGVCRIGRKANLLTNTEIHCVVHSEDPRETAIKQEKARKDGKELPANNGRRVEEKTMLNSVHRAKNMAHTAARDDLRDVGHNGVRLTRMSDWFDNTRAAVEYQSLLDRSFHWEQFERLAKHRGWEIKLAPQKDKVFTGKSKDPEDLPDELRTPEQLYAELCQLSKKEPKFTVHEFMELTSQALEATHVADRSTRDLLSADVFFAIRNCPTFSLDEDDFRYLRYHRSTVERHVKLRYCKPRDLRLDSAARLVHEERRAHPEMSDSAVNLSRAARAHDIASRALGIPSLLQPGTELPDEIIAALNEEKIRKKVREKKVPDQTLVELGLEDAGAGPLVAKLMRAVPLLGGHCKGSVHDALKVITGALAVTMDVQETERAVDKVRVRHLFKSVTLRCRIEDILKHYTLWVGDVRVPLSQYAEYSARLDSERAETTFAREMEALNKCSERVPVDDTRVELLDVAALQSLAKTVQHHDSDIRTMVDRMVAEAKSHPTIDGVVQIETTYHRIYGFGRRYGTFPSLQMAAKRIRGPLASKLYHDIDVVNAHFVIMMQVASAHGTELESVVRVVQDRDTVLENVQHHYRCGRDSAKQLLLSALNGGTADHWMQECSIDEEICRRIAAADDDLEHVSIVQELLDDYQTIRSLMFKKYADQVQNLKECVQRARPGRTQPAIKRTVFSLCLQAEEDKILTTMDEFLTESGWSVDVLVYDGCMVRRQNDLAFDAKLLTECETAVLSATGYKVQLLEKCLHCGLTVAKCGCVAISKNAEVTENIACDERPSKQQRVN
jgi:hypothetical protein